jgi:mono/diheme cytochrome c family protein
VSGGLKIFGFVVVVLAFYSYVGHMVPQKITYPPETAELSGELTPAELASAGQEIVAGKGTCLGCHTVGSSDAALRFPDLGSIGAVAGDRVEGLSGVEYLAQSLYEPGAYIVEGFLPGMPVINRPPIGLTDQEILAVIAYLQSLGGEPTVTLDTELAYQTPEGSAPAASTPAAATSEPGSGLDGPGVAQAYLCATCHRMDEPGALVGPSLYDVGARLSRAELYESVMDPDAVLAEGFPGGVMQVTLNATGFYSKLSPDEIRALVDYLESKQGQ